MKKFMQDHKRFCEKCSSFWEKDANKKCRFAGLAVGDTLYKIRFTINGAILKIKNEISRKNYIHRPFDFKYCICLSV